MNQYDDDDDPGESAVRDVCGTAQQEEHIEHSRDEEYMKLAEKASDRSKDPDTKVRVLT